MKKDNVSRPFKLMGCLFVLGMLSASPLILAETIKITYSVANLMPPIAAGVIGSDPRRELTIDTSATVKDLKQKIVKKDYITASAHIIFVNQTLDIDSQTLAEVGLTQNTAISLRK